MTPQDNINMRIVPSRKEDDSDTRDDSQKRVRRVPASDKDFKRLLDDKEDQEAEATLAQQAKRKPISLFDTTEEKTVSPEDTEAYSKAKKGIFDGAFSRDRAIKRQKEYLSAEEQKVGGEKAASEQSGSLQKPIARSKGFGERSEAKSDVEEDSKAEDKEQPESPFMVYKKQIAGKENLSMQYGSDEETDSAGLLQPSRRKGMGQKETGGTRFHQEQADLTFVNPLGTPVRSVGEKIEEFAKPAATTNIQEIVDQIVKELYTIEQAGKTDTVITLQYPPMFKDAQIVVTSFTSAVNEFNIAFENLTAPAKQLLDDNLFSLRTSLEAQGYVNAIHIITTTTIVEHPMPGDDSQRFARGDKEGQGQQQEEEQEQG